jgi:hypothetical protein
LHFDWKMCDHRKVKVVSEGLQREEPGADVVKRDIVFETVEEALVNQKETSREKKKI